jgi:molybdopterin biosynthesis enzyme
VRARRRRSDAAAVELEPLTGQESHMIARAAAADALVLVPRGEGELEPGSAVRFLRLG